MNQPIIAPAGDPSHAASPEEKEPSIKKASLAAAVKALRERFAAEQVKDTPPLKGAFGAGRRSNHVSGWKREKE
jgi:hypothetical protein